MKQTPEMDVYVKSVISKLEQYDMDLLEFIKDLSNQICEYLLFLLRLIIFKFAFCASFASICELE